MRYHPFSNRLTVFVTRKRVAFFLLAQPDERGSAVILCGEPGDCDSHTLLSSMPLKTRTAFALLNVSTHVLRSKSSLIHNVGPPDEVFVEIPLSAQVSAQLNPFSPIFICS